MNNHRAKARHIRKYASKQLRINLGIFSVVYAALFVVTLYTVTVSQAIFWQVVLAIIIGVIVGFISSRMYKISWNSNEAKVIGRIDAYGVVVLLLFAAFELNREAIAALFTSGESTGVIGLVLITSALFGRILGTTRSILQILKSENMGS